MRPRKVGMVLNTLGFGGVPEAVLQLGTHLPADRFAVQVYVLKGEPAAPESLLRFQDSGLPVTVAGPSDGKIGAVAELADWLLRERIDILHCHSYRPNLYGRLAGALCRPQGLRIVAHYHNQYDDKWSVDPAALRLERHLAGVTDAMVAVSQSVQNHMAKAIGTDPARITVIPNGIGADKIGYVDRDEARRHLGIAEGSLAIGLIGRICAQKGQEDLVSAALLLRDRMPEAVFLMIGAPEDERLHQSLRARIDAVGASNSVRFTGHLTQIALAYRGLDILAAPSRWEGFGLMLVEAMAAGLPIVATDAGAIPEVTGGAACLVPVADPGALADAIQSFDEPRRRQAAADGQIRAKAFEWSSAAARLASLYDTLP
jgi:glycosyltransferase involved in cell wall biosynthesis